MGTGHIKTNFYVGLTIAVVAFGAFFLSSSDPDPKTSGLSADGSGCSVQGYRLGDLPVENSCALGEDMACRVLPNVAVEAGRPFQIAGSFAQRYLILCRLNDTSVVM